MYSLLSKKPKYRAVLSAAIAVSFVAVWSFAASNPLLKAYAADADGLEKAKATYTESFDMDAYSAYIKKYSAAACPDARIVLEAESCTVETGEAVDRRNDFAESKGVSVYMKETDRLSWSFAVPETGLYHLLVNYYPVEGDGGEIQRRLYLDGNIPFSEADNLSFCRLWANREGGAMVDTQGNQIMIEQQEVPAWTSQYAQAPASAGDEPLRFYLTKGSHTLTMEGIMEPMLIKSVSFCPVLDAAAAPYQEVGSQYKNRMQASASAAVWIQAEEADVKSNQMLYPMADRTSPTVQPYDYAKIVYNTLGRSQWTNAGQWAEWKFYVSESACYSLSAHYKQSLKEGRASVRRIQIDGETPFAEADDWRFPYDSVWQTGWFADENNVPYSFWLDEGWHTLRLTVGLGSYSDMIATASEYLSELNAIYRSVIAISGANPDQYRDYKFDVMIPGTIEQMAQMSAKLKALEKEVLAADKNARTVGDIGRIYNTLDLMLKDTDTIAARLTTLKDNIASFGTWINTQRGQPLELDWLRFSSSAAELPKGEAGIFGLVGHYIKQFFQSFLTDYEMMGQTELSADASVKVWMMTSQDQAQVLRQLTVSDFTPNNKIAAEVQLVSQKALLPAILADRGPDVALGIAQSEINNLALRNAVYNLGTLPGMDKMREEFYPHSMAPFEWNGGVYALQETEVWPMLFYRKDILKELDIDTKELNTWDSILQSVLPKLKNSSLDFGIMPTIQNYLTFCYQYGGTLYDESGTQSGLSGSAAIESMKLFSMLYKQYGFLLSFDFSNRFRTGEMPIAIADFTSYNNLMLFASEIKGLWGMLPVPGTPQEDGTVSHATVATLTGTAIMSGTKNLDAAWTFLQWWNSADTQDTFGKRLESVVGTAARYNTANRKAIAKVRWEPDMRQSMLAQADEVMPYTEVPGGYFTSRLFSFAFRSIVYNDAEVRESMNSVAADINLEMANKRKEYGLE